MRLICKRENDLVLRSSALHCKTILVVYILKRINIVIVVCRYVTSSRFQITIFQSQMYLTQKLTQKHIRLILCLLL